MKKLFLLALVAIFATSAQAQTDTKTASPEKAKVQMNEAVEETDEVMEEATEEVKEAAKETKEAMKTGDKEAKKEMKGHEGHDHAAKDHVCTKACTADAHAYACGEKGHTCSEACHAKK